MATCAGPGAAHHFCLPHHGIHGMALAKAELPCCIYSFPHALFIYLKEYTFSSLTHERNASLLLLSDRI